MKTPIHPHRFACYLICLFALLACNGYASEPATGTFSVTQNCEAFAGFKSGSNPGQIQVSPGERFTIREVNNKDYAWLRVEVPRATPALRWVAATCGSASGLQTGLARTSVDHAFSRLSGKQPITPPVLSDACNIAGQFESYVLAIT